MLKILLISQKTTYKPIHVTLNVSYRFIMYMFRYNSTVTGNYRLCLPTNKGGRLPEEEEGGMLILLRLHERMLLTGELSGDDPSSSLPYVSQLPVTDVQNRLLKDCKKRKLMTKGYVLFTQCSKEE